MAGSSKKVIYAALIGNSLIAITKFFAAFMTRSSAMMSEGIHSTVDSCNQLLLLYGLKKGDKPASEDFPFGHGKEIYFWAFVVSVSIFAVGAVFSIYEGIHALQDPHVIEDPTINYIVLILAMIFEGFAWYFAFKEFQKDRGKRSYLEAVKTSKNPSIFVVLFEDSAAMLGLVIAFVGILLGQITAWPYWDGIAAITIGVLLALTAAWLAYETKGLLIGEAASKTIVSDMREMIRTTPDVSNVNEVLTVHMGPDYVLANVSVEFSDHMKADEIEATIAGIDSSIKEKFPVVKRVFVEAEARAKAVTS